jgi:hypothetical protein
MQKKKSAETVAGNGNYRIFLLRLQQAFPKVMLHHDECGSLRSHSDFVILLFRIQN